MTYLYIYYEGFCNDCVTCVSKLHEISVDLTIKVIIMIAKTSNYTTSAVIGWSYYTETRQQFAGRLVQMTSAQSRRAVL
jgi:hypothetical protein